MKMKKINTKIVKARSKQLVGLQARIIDNKNSGNFWGEKSSQISHNKEWLEWNGRNGRIIIDEIGKDNSVVGRNDYYKPVVVKDSKLKLGDVVNVRIISVMQNYLEADLV
jgi:tRNA A37 methylthiotransferase MiaB